MSEAKERFYKLYNEMDDSETEEFIYVKELEEEIKQKNEYIKQLEKWASVTRT